MARTSLAAAKAELYGMFQVAGVPNITGVTAVYSYEPPAGKLALPVSITISTAGLGVDDYRIQLRIYISAQVDAQVAQSTMDTMLLAVEQKIHDSPAGSGWPRTDWSVGYDHDIDAFIGVCNLMVGREDLW